ncbi:MAG: hypothetical protein V1738_02915 [Patescibacteria group bacterium]
MPTTRQLKTLKILSENVGIPLGQAMREAGYSSSTSKTPARLTSSKGWSEAVREALPEDSLLAAHHNLLAATTIQSMLFPKDMRSHEIKKIICSVPDNALVTIKDTRKGKKATYTTLDRSTVLLALQMAYRVRGLYSPKKMSVAIDSGLESLTEEELDEKINKLTEVLHLEKNNPN